MKLAMTTEYLIRTLTLSASPAIAMSPSFPPSVGFGTTRQTRQMALYNSGLAATTPETALSASLSYFGLYGPLRLEAPAARGMAEIGMGGFYESID